MGIKDRLAAAYLPASIETRRLRAAPHPRATVFMYHEVLPDSVDMPSWLVVKESLFEQQMRHLKQHYDVLSLDDAITRLNEPASRSASTRPIAVITFDDGYAGNFSCALPILRSLGLPFTVYVATSRILEGGRYWYDDVISALISAGHGTVTINTSLGTLRYSGNTRYETRRWKAINDFLTELKRLPATERLEIAGGMTMGHEMQDLRMMTPDELGRLSAECGVTIGNHTHGHDLLDQLDEDTARSTITRAQSYLEEWTGQEIRHFSYPNGNYTASTVALVTRLGYSSAVTTASRAWVPSDDRLQIPRIGIGRFDNLNLFRAKACGLVG